MADISLYLTNVNVSIGRSMDAGPVSKQLLFIYLFPFIYYRR